MNWSKSMTTVRAHAVLACLLGVTALAATVTTTAAASDDATVPVVSNDNRRPAGTLENDVLTLTLRAGRGVWHPEGPAGPGLTIEAFGEAESPLTVPAPMIRVKEGTRIVASIANQLDVPLVVHGLCTRDGARCSPLSVPAGDTRAAEFRAGRPGTYHYWATAMGAPVPFRELAGAFIVDPAEGSAADRVLVITEWTSLSPPQLREI